MEPDPFARVDRVLKARLAAPATALLPGPRRVRRLYELQPRVRVLTPDGLEWEIVRCSYTGPQTPGAKKWCWLRRGGNEYRQVVGSQALYRLRLVDRQEDPRDG